MPPERRVYSKNPVQLPEGLDIHQWMYEKNKQFSVRLSSHQIGKEEYKFTYFRKELTKLGSFISCTGIIRAKDIKTVELLNLVSMINHGDYTINMRSKGGDLGPMNERDRIEILIPCIEEFLEPPSNSRIPNEPKSQIILDGLDATG
ncbi:hypothetical protein EHQ79_08315 [Leptospira jelokensis]|nr:hypothetical protein EHQ79_08315 [Leptospira jelokensis]